MGGGLRRLRSGTKRANLSFRKQLSRVVATRVAGAAVGTAGIALMGIGTVASPTVSGGAQFAPAADATNAPLTVVSGSSTTSSGQQTIVSISEDCSAGVTSGTLTVNNAVAGNTVTLGVYAHQDPNGDGLWHYTGAHTVITMVSGHTTYSYTISGVPAAYSDGPVSGAPGNDSNDPDGNGDDYNSWRVQVVTTSGTFAGSATKSKSFGCSVPGTTTSSSSSSSRSSSSSSSSSSSVTSSTPGSSTSSSSTTRTSTATAGVAGATTSTPSTGANIAFGVGLGLLLIGGGLLFGGRRLRRRPRK